jgi:hypothetical protein
MHGTHNFDVMPRMSVMLAGQEGVRLISLFQPMRAQGAQQMSKSGAGEVRVGRGTDLFATIEPMHGNALVVYGAYGGEKLDRHVVTEKMSEGHALAVADVLLTGQRQIVAGWRGKGGGVSLFTPLDKQRADWRENAIDHGGMACEDLCLADLNADGKLDIIASGRATKNVKIYWNETASAASTKPADRP